MTKTTIEWADEVWNPVTGCSKVSQGCKNCYAERIAERFWGERKFTDVQLHPERLESPRRWKKPRRVFVNSMSDLFHEKLDMQQILVVFYRMALYDRHTFIVLTKRPQRMIEFFEFWKEHIIRMKEAGYAYFAPPLRNVWLGVSVENQSADERIQLLLQTPAAVRFVSVEPMLEDIYLMDWLKPDYASIQNQAEWGPVDPNDSRYRSIDWVICGCESGPGARPFSMDWARGLRDQCQAAGVPFFFKQGRDASSKIVKMPELDGHTWAQYPEGTK